MKNVFIIHFLQANCCLLASLALTACVACSPHLPDESLLGLEVELAAAGLDQSQALSDILEKLGLHFVQDVRLLKMPEELELVDSLRSAGINLGSRSKLRQLYEGSTGPVQSFSDLAGHTWSADVIPSMWTMRRAQGEPAKADPADGGGGVSVETLAIALTALLGLGSYVMQAKIARDTTHADKEHDRRVVEREKSALLAGVQLDRVRVQQADLLQPLAVQLGTYIILS